MTKEGQLFEDVKKRLNMLCEYDSKVGLKEFTLLANSNNFEEADDTQPEDDGAGAPSSTDMGGMDPNAGAVGQMPPMDGGQGIPPTDPNGGMPSDGVPNGGAMPPVPGQDMGDGTEGGVQTPEGFNPQDDLSAGSFEGGADTEQPGDEVLDVTELTDKQDDIEKEIHEVGGKFDEVLKAIGSFEELIRSNDEKIEDLRAEIERRNPTQIEKLGNQKNLSYPFNVSPEDYWKEKEATSNYSTEDDDNGKEQGQYVITANDVDGDTNWAAIAKSLEDKDFLYNQTLDKLLKF